MRVLIALALAAVLAIGGAAVASADGHEPPPEHPHALVLGLEFGPDEEPISARKCVDLAANRSLRLNAHHAHAHTGRAGEALFSASHAVVPLAPLTPWANCAELMAAFGL